jgi:hypothetical protein
MIKSLKDFLKGLVVGALVALFVFSQMPKPEPEIKIVEKLVEVEKKKVSTKKKLDYNLDGSFTLEVDEIAEFLKNRKSDIEIQQISKEYHHSFSSLNTDRVKGIHYQYSEKNLSAGVGYKDGAFWSVGVRF